MVTHSSIPAWRIPRTEEPGGLQFIGLQRVRHGLKRLSMHAAIPSLHIVRNALTFIDWFIKIGCWTQHVLCPKAHNRVEQGHQFYHFAGQLGSRSAGASFPVPRPRPQRTVSFLTKFFFSGSPEFWFSLLHGFRAPQDHKSSCQDRKPHPLHEGPFLSSQSSCQSSTYGS